MRHVSLKAGLTDNAGLFLRFVTISLGQSRILFFGKCEKMPIFPSENVK